MLFKVGRAIMDVDQNPHKCLLERTSIRLDWNEIRDFQFANAP